MMTGRADEGDCGSILAHRYAGSLEDRTDSEVRDVKGRWMDRGLRIEKPFAEIPEGLEIRVLVNAAEIRRGGGRRLVDVAEQTLLL
jgi:hypothetical protein